MIYLLGPRYEPDAVLNLGDPAANKAGRPLHAAHTPAQQQEAGLSSAASTPRRHAHAATPGPHGDRGPELPEFQLPRV